MSKQNYSKMYKNQAVENTNKQTQELVTELLSDDEVVIESQKDEDLVTELPSDEVVEESILSKKGIVTNCNRLNVRSLPSKNSEVVKILNQTDEVEIFDDNIPDWFKISFKNHVGFCMKKFIKVI